ncbi:helix-turn-helix domain-containing protein [Roseixanthobacter glucoisosaccharinicivorans]|uniref:helix-turn-helix domain-containing protein n=1 Tax=Roseixanthobacter glucoisosaccharinicivorans TaxID=3119923 RepID=UPI003728FA67
MSRIPPKAAGLARALYEAGTPIRQIAAETGLSLASVYFWADRIVEPDGTVHHAPAPRRYGGRTTKPPSRSRRRVFLARLWHAAERQMDEIDARVAALDGPEAAPARPGARDSEKDAKALAVLARVVRELGALDGAGAAEKSPATGKGGAAAQSEEGLRGRSLDTFRRELARRLDRLRQGGDGAEPAG